MRQFQTSGRPRDRVPGATCILAAMLGIIACGLDNIPPELKPLIDRRLPWAVSLAESAAKQCAERKQAKGPAPTTSPAAGKSLAEELGVIEILVRCDWDQSDEMPEGGSFAFPPLRGTGQHTHSPSARLVYDTFVKRGERGFEQVYVPSQFSDVASSADIIATRPIAGGGTVEVTIATVNR